MKITKNQLQEMIQKSIKKQLTEAYNSAGFNYNAGGGITRGYSSSDYDYNKDEENSDTIENIKCDFSDMPKDGQPHTDEQVATKLVYIAQNAKSANDLRFNTDTETWQWGDNKYHPSYRWGVITIFTANDRTFETINHFVFEDILNAVKSLRNGIEDNEEFEVPENEINDFVEIEVGGKTNKEIIKVPTDNLTDEEIKIIKQIEIPMNKITKFDKEQLMAYLQLISIFNRQIIKKLNVDEDSFKKIYQKLVKTRPASVRTLLKAQ